MSKMKSSLAPQVLELMMMLFNVETYRCVSTFLFKELLPSMSSYY